MNNTTLEILTLSKTLSLCSGGGITDDVTIEANITDSTTKTEQIIILNVSGEFQSLNLLKLNRPSTCLQSNNTQSPQLTTKSFMKQVYL